MDSAAALSKFLASKEVIQGLKEFTSELNEQLEDICADIERINHAKYRQKFKSMM